MHIYRRINKPRAGDLRAYALDPTEAIVQPGWPHGDAWGIVMGHPESHDTERHREALKRAAEKKGKSK